MSEKPILFSTPMVQAILAGRKTMTRRVVKKKYSNTNIEKRRDILIEVQNDTPPDVYNPETKMTTRHLKMCVPINQPYRVGDVLWVRETWANTWTPDDYEGYVYKADGVPEKFPYWGDGRNCKDEVWRPSIFMPRSAARIFLKVKSVKVERLQDITEEDARSEGCIDFHDKIGDGKFDDVAEFDFTAKDAFIELWDSLNAKRGYGCDLNPWVWVIEFERMEA
ncbi:MAG: hypothetical protein M0T74_06585 [Desulfitobacterium hafniense]|nr:hypothetical protein [Desulfitobacterium hafniense]